MLLPRPGAGTPPNRAKTSPSSLTKYALLAGVVPLRTCRGIIARPVGVQHSVRSKRVDSHRGAPGSERRLRPQRASRDRRAAGSRGRTPMRRWPRRSRRAGPRPRSRRPVPASAPRGSSPSSLARSGLEPNPHAVYGPSTPVAATNRRQNSSTSAMRAHQRLDEVLGHLAVAHSPVELVGAVAMKRARHLDASAAAVAGDVLGLGHERPGQALLAGALGAP